ncbi:MAG: hypothetical protein GXY67_10040 [Clostridiales bacterium]|nr:hypothetical protein [Clostridiales bacterium]
MEHLLLSPPVAFLILLGLCWALSTLTKGLAPQGKMTDRKLQSYACGETMEQNQAQPEYGEFFKFALFFTMMHVIALVVASDPGGLSLQMGVYLGVTALGLFALLRRSPDESR